MMISQLGDNIRYFDKDALWKLVLDAEENERNRSVYSDLFKTFLDKQNDDAKFPVTMEFLHNDFELRMQIGIDDKGSSIMLDCDHNLVEKLSKRFKTEKDND